MQAPKQATLCRFYLTLFLEVEWLHRVTRLVVLLLRLVVLLLTLPKSAAPFSKKIME